MSWPNFCAGADNEHARGAIESDVRGGGSGAQFPGAVPGARARDAGPLRPGGRRGQRGQRVRGVPPAEQQPHVVYITRDRHLSQPAGGARRGGGGPAAGKRQRRRRGGPAAAGAGVVAGLGLGAVLALSSSSGGLLEARDEDNEAVADEPPCTCSRGCCAT